MFTGIIETIGIITDLQKKGSNLNITINSAFTKELKIDQSIAHNGTCLTVIEINDDYYQVTAIDETLKRTNLGFLKVNDKINLERSMMMNGRLDGHLVQGHVDITAICTNIEDKTGSRIFIFENDGSVKNLTVEKGSVCVNGVSLTVVQSSPHSFSVAIIPYTFNNTNFNQIKKGDVVNVEFDIIGKYVAKFISQLR